MSKDSICEVYRETKKIRLDTSNFENLPGQVLSKIFQFCDLPSLRNLSLTSSRFRKIIGTDNYFPSEKSRMSLEELPSEILLKIFSYLDRPSTGNLSRVSHRFKDLGQAECLWIKTARECLVTNNMRAEMRSRSIHSLTARDKVRVSTNWKRGNYSEVRLLVQDARYMPRIQLEKDILWVTWGNRIWAHPRASDGTIHRTTTRVLKGHGDDVSRFVSKDGILVSGGRDAAMLGWDSVTGEFLFAKRYCHSGEVSAVDISTRHQIIMSGSRDRMVKLWNLNSNNNENNQNHSNNNNTKNPSFPSLVHAIDIGDRIWSLSSSPDGSQMVIGSAGLGGVPALHLMDLEHPERLEPINGHLKKGAGTLDICWHGENSFLSCGYDTYTRLWDIRMRRDTCVRSWQEPFDESIYCLSTDNNMTMICGTARHGLVRLWDMRQKSPVQMYYAKPARKGQSSPVYSVAFDSSNLYVALDQSLNLLSFSGSKRLQGSRKRIFRK